MGSGVDSSRPLGAQNDTRGGFDAVIGNPPYLRIQGLQEFYGAQIAYLAANYQSAVKRFDLYLLFIERGFQLLAQGGYLGFICPHKFINSDFGSGLRQFLIDNIALDTFISFGNNLVFDQATTYTGLISLRRNITTGFRYFEFPDLPVNELPNQLQALADQDYSHYRFTDLTAEPWVLTLSATKRILDRIQQPQTLGEVFESIFQGVVTGVDDLYFLGRTERDNGEEIEVYSQREDRTIIIERGIVKPMLKGEDISRYTAPSFQYYCIYPYKLVGDKTVILKEDELASQFPLAYNYLQKYRNELRDLRVKFKTNPKYWYSCHRGRSIVQFATERIVTPEISLGCNMTLDDNSFYHNTKVYSLIPPGNRQEKIQYWLGVLNSKVMWWFLSNTGYVLRGGYFVFKTNYLNPFPIRTIDFTNKHEAAQHAQMVQWVDRMLALHQQLAAAQTEDKRRLYQQQIDATDKQIDALVYQLYGLTDDEIKIVEGRA